MSKFCPQQKQWKETTKEVQGRHSIFLNNLQAGKVSEFITNLIVCKRDRKVSQKARNILHFRP